MPSPLGILAVAGAGAAGGANSFDLLETTLISTNTVSVTFSNLNNYSDYKHLQIRMTHRGSAASTSNTSIQIRFNGDSGNNYPYHRLWGDGSTVASTAQTATSEIALLDSLPLNSNTSGIFGAAIIDILDFSNASKNKTLRALYGVRGSNSSIALSSGFRTNTAAITSISLEGQESFVSGTRLSLYGIK